MKTALTSQVFISTMIQTDLGSLIRTRITQRNAPYENRSNITGNENQSEKKTETRTDNRSEIYVAIMCQNLLSSIYAAK